MRRIEKIVSGGQSGVDRAALDVALELGCSCGGWCPKGRRAEDGPINARYRLTETPTADYAVRTEWNVRDSDGTLILTRGAPTEGTAWTVQMASRLRKHCWIIDFSTVVSDASVHDWIERYHIRVLNVAGPRESKCPGIYADAGRFLRCLLSSP